MGLEFTASLIAEKAELTPVVEAARRARRLCIIHRAGSPESHTETGR